ncbi:Aste57867_23310 [Aphanomyces stellatus]|uniref:Aste57867_23310 protein n=1 Tax=Aphanomyces stellatus TaxID=120398 RepID=A0A485LP90_9STRA|nr:hypothetical protein As57867_023239 [Aphanomyces stellatus]VFT99955.1 Aste57867_23310 [Aphanomyces stellatus]
MELPASTGGDAAFMCLHMQELVTLIASFQDGIFGDLCVRFAQRSTTIRAGQSPNIQLYVTSSIHFHPRTLVLHPEHHDTRFPLHMAIYQGELEVVQRILACQPSLLTTDALACAVRHQHVHVVKFLVTILHVDDTKSAIGIIDNGHPQWDMTPLSLLDFCAHENNLELLEVLLPHVEHLTGGCSVVDYAARHGNLDLLRFLHQTESCSTTAFVRAVQGGHAPALQFLAQNFPTPLAQLVGATQLFGIAGAGGNLDVIALLALTLFPNDPTTDMARAAALAGHVAVLEWLFEHKQERGSLDYWEHVVRAGHVNVLKWMARVHRWSRDKHVPPRNAFQSWLRQSIVRPAKDLWSTVVQPPPVPRNWTLRPLKAGVVQNPVQVAKLELVDFLHAFGHPLHCICPTSVPVAQFLFDHGIRFTHDHILVAIGGDGFEKCAIEYRATNHCPKLDAADVVKFMHLKCPNVRLLPLHMATAAACGLLEVVQFLLNHGVACTTQALNSAIRNGHLEVVQFLHQHLPAPSACSHHALTHAIRHGNLQLVQFVHQHFDPQPWDVAIMFTPLDVFEYLVDHRTRYDNFGAVFVEAVAYSRVDLMAKIVARNPDIVTTTIVEQALVRAVRTGALQLIGYLWYLGLMVWQEEQRQAIVDTLQAILANTSDHCGSRKKLQTLLHSERTTINGCRG